MAANKSMRYIKRKAILRYIHLKDRRASASFLLRLDDHVQSKLDEACELHNGGKKTLDAFIAAFIKL